MTNILSLDFKSSALLIALVLVPIVILFCAVALILACSEYRFTRPSWLPRWCRCRDRRGKQKRLRSDLESSVGNRETEVFDGALEYESPVTGLEHV